MGARRSRARGRNRAQGPVKTAGIGEASETKKEESRGYNVDFQELSKELSPAELGPEKTKESDESGCEGDDFADTEVGQGERINVEKTANEESLRIAAGAGSEAQSMSEDGAAAAREPRVFHPMTPNVLTAVIPQTPRRRVLHEEGSHLLVKEESMVVPSKMVINRYPGHLFVHMDQIGRFVTPRSDVDGVSVRVESKAASYETKKYRVCTDIAIGEMLRIPIPRMDGPGVVLRFVLLLHHKSGGVTKSCEATLAVDVGRIHSIHNNLLESMLIWDNYVSRNVFKNIRSFFTSGTPDAWSLKTYLSFISDDELRLIPAPFPHDLRSLSKWLVVKKFSYNIWFKGFVNIRGDVGGICTNLWKRRYVKCYGYMIFVFNEHSRSLVGTINLVEGSFDPSSANRVYLENFLRIGIGESIVELHFDTRDKYNTCKSTLATMLPKTLFYKKR